MNWSEQWRLNEKNKKQIKIKHCCFTGRWRYGASSFTLVPPFVWMRMIMNCCTHWNLETTKTLMIAVVLKPTHCPTHTHTHPLNYTFIIGKGSNVTTRCDPGAVTLCSARREGGEWTFGERLQYEKSPSGDEKSFLQLTWKRPHRTLTLIYVSICLLLLWDIWEADAWGSQVKAHVGPDQVWRAETSWLSILRSHHIAVTCIFIIKLKLES